jgi:hypothetical protein
MQRKPFVRNLVTTAGWLWLVACGSPNEKLFDGQVLPLMVQEPASMESFMEPAAEPPPPPPVVMEVPRSTETTGGDLPLASEMQMPPPSLPVTEPPPPVQQVPEGPRIVSVSPADGARGVSNDVHIVITFNVPMDQAQTEAAYQSEGIPSSGVTFSWNEQGTQLTITPDDPLVYPAGTDPQDVVSRPINFFVSASASDQDGNHLAAPQEFSFALLRQINVSLPAQQNRDLTGNWRSNDTYGQGDCARNQDTVCVGDNGAGGLQYKGFMSFDLSSLPATMAQLSSARLNFQITQRSGNPFNGLGALFLEHAAFEAIGPDAFQADPLATVGALPGAGNTGTVIQADVRAALSTDVSSRSRSQFRLEFAEVTNDNRNQDTLISAWDTQRIDVSYLIP